MNYIIFDLEWNNAYNYASKKAFNEIIEIGALKLDSNLNIVDTFKLLIKPKYSKKLTSRCVNLTNITNEEISEYGVPFEEAISDFRSWSRGEDNVFLSWSNSDLYVLINNFRSLLGNSQIDFMNYYCDAQKYCMSFMELSGPQKNNQVGLANCAKMFDVEVDLSKLHRALADCYVTAECLKKVYDAEKIKKFISKCNSSFFGRLMFKPYYITNPVYQSFDVSKIDVNCPLCSQKTTVISPYENINKTFRGVVKCESCSKTFWSYVRAKKTYDNIIVSKKTVEMNKRKAKKINK